VLQIWFDGLVLLVEECEIRDDIFDDICVRERVDLGLLLGVCRNAAQTSQSIDTINVHRTASTNALSATPSEGQGGIDLILNSDQRIQHHRTRLLQVQSIALHARLRCWLIGIPSVDVERLDLRV